MKLINTKGTLEYIQEGNEVAAELAFIERMKTYTMKQNGATILITHRANGRLLTCINPFDKTQFICDESGFELAADFGAKRFLAGEARVQMQEDKSEHAGVIKFARDLSFPIDKKENETAVDYCRLDLRGALKQFRSDRDRFYVQLSELFNRCADFTPGKQAEYLAGGKKQDKYCRFNLPDKEEDQPVSTEHVFLMNDNNHIVGTISCILLRSKTSLDIYFYDEIVDYFTLLDASDIAKVYAFTASLNKLNNNLKSEDHPETQSTLKNEITAIENEITALIEPKRMYLMAQLFAAARESLREKISGLDDKIAAGQVHAFIRAAKGREEAYAELGCGSTNTGNFVIHGDPTPQLSMQDTYIKSWAAEELEALQPRLNPAFSLVGSSKAVAASEELSNTSSYAATW